MQIIDQRILRVGVEVSGVVNWYEGLQIIVRGAKGATDTDNSCEVTISNLSKEVRNFILTETSPFNKNRTPKRVIVEAGRITTGVSRIFVGDVVRSSPTQPPDIGLEMTVQTGAFKKGELVGRSGAAMEPLSALSQRVAADLGVEVQFEAIDKLVANYSFSGAALRQIKTLAQTGGVDAFLNNETLVVKERGKPLRGRVKVVNSGTGMIGLPEATEKGVKVKVLYDPSVDLGSRIDLTSELNPALDGAYTVYKISFDLSSRDTAWYLDLETSRN